MDCKSSCKSRLSIIITPRPFSSSSSRYLLWSLWLSPRPLTPSRCLYPCPGFCDYLWKLYPFVDPEFKTIIFQQLQCQEMLQWIGGAQAVLVYLINWMSDRGGYFGWPQRSTALWGSYKHKQMTWTWWSHPTLAIMETRNILTREKQTCSNFQSFPRFCRNQVSGVSSLRSGRWVPGWEGWRCACCRLLIAMMMKIPRHDRSWSWAHSKDCSGSRNYLRHKIWVSDKSRSEPSTAHETMYQLQRFFGGLLSVGLAEQRKHRPCKFFILSVLRIVLWS